LVDAPPEIDGTACAGDAAGAPLGEAAHDDGGDGAHDDFDIPQYKPPASREGRNGNAR
jgi:hypothetical protein